MSGAQEILPDEAIQSAVSNLAAKKTADAAWESRGDDLAAALFGPASLRRAELDRALFPDESEDAD